MHAGENVGMVAPGHIRYRVYNAAFRPLLVEIKESDNRVRLSIVVEGRPDNAEDATRTAFIEPAVAKVIAGSLAFAAARTAKEVPHD